MDKFYKTSHLTLSQKKELLIKAKEKSFKWLPNILDLSKDYSRVYINKNFDELLEKVEEGTYILFHQPISGFLAVGFSILWMPFGIFFVTISGMVCKWANSFMDKRMM